MRHHRRHRDPIALLDLVSEDLAVLKGRAEQDEERGMDAQRLFHCVLRLLEIAKGLKRIVLTLRIACMNLVSHPLQEARMAEKLDQGPSGRHRAGVMAREHRGHEHARDLVVAEAGTIRVLGVHQGLKKVFASIPGAAAILYDLGNHLSEACACSVAAAERRNRKVGMNVAPGDDPALEVVIDLREFFAHLIAKLGTEQTSARGEVRQHSKELGGLDLALVAPTFDDVQRLFGNDLRVGAHPCVAERRVEHVHLLRHACWLGAIGNTLAEHGDHHLIGSVRA